MRNIQQQLFACQQATAGLSSDCLEQQDATSVVFPCVPVRYPTHSQGFGNMVMHASRQPPRKANSIYSSAWTKGRVPSAASKALRHHNTMQDWLSTDYYPDVLRGLLLIRCPSFTLHLLSHLCVTNMSCLMPGSLPVPWCVVFCWVFFGLGWLGVCFLFGCLFSFFLACNSLIRSTR